MASLFNKDPTARPAPPPYGLELIEREIAHLRNPKPSREKPGERLTVGRVVSMLAICLVLGLYFMDPFLYALHKGEAIRAYLYLHHAGEDQKVQALLATRILSEAELEKLNRQPGSFQDYFANKEQAEQKADSIVGYMHSLYYLRVGAYDELDPIGKLRYLLFSGRAFFPRPTGTA